ncbi:virulence factor TspB C-terminal domain-related protein [Variovorax sp. EL159]|uniref:virulence factor TspB C-terminal domain-related protein n=1 Tax=Variovorax sp. EL159 TaxID=1566270 RepID=UPI0008852E55|nr:virulence factor TspB C-terminal domain-related protein [Variovorax sp. EL159]SCX52591.1 hypothetical protein SAMN03159363_1233 [Variovorax sp. EL159]
MPKDGKETTEKKNPDGSTTRTDETTRCNGVKCEKDTRVCSKGTDGLETCETTTTTSDQSGFCTKGENKGNKVCQGQGEGTPTSFGGTCASGFIAVSDDAVINAMAAETFRQNCKVNPDDGETTLAKTERIKTGNRTGDNPNNDKVSISSGAIDTSDALGGAAMCIGDKTINVMGLSPVTIPFSRWCDGFPLLGNLMLACSFLLAGVIILRR